MKRIRFLPFILALLLLCTSCQRPTYELPWDTFCSTDTGEVELTAQERSFIIDLLNDAENWTYAIAKCPSDYTFHAQRQTIGYNCESGVFNDFTRQRSCILSEEDREALNAILRAK